MRAHTFQSFQAVAPWAGSCLIHGVLVLVLVFEGVQRAQTSKTLPAGRVTMNVPARVVTRPAMPVAIQKKRVKLTSPDGKVALPRAQEVKAPSAEPTPTATSQAPSGGGGSGVLTLKERYLFGLRNRIETHKTYPAMSKRLGETGRVVVALSLTRDGSIQGVAIKAGSSFERLDRAALETVKAVEKYEPIPSEIPENLIAVEVPIEYAL